mmetsp:Transcript_79767/g.252141  ORF Transcript_79767/g.252141 Transcript_79767/m.252141 type:complete len:295 (-) Transcript_79767:94-978(-)
MVKAKAKAMVFDHSDKTYRQGIDRIIASTAMRDTDLDAKAIRLLDYLEQHGGRATAAVQHLGRALHGKKRQEITNWHAYVYTLLRGFDEEAYREMKAAEWEKGRKGQGAAKLGAPTPALPASALNPQAAEFVPGHTWLEPAPAASASKAPAAAEVQHPEHTPEVVEECLPLLVASLLPPSRSASPSQLAGQAGRPEKPSAGSATDRLWLAGLHGLGGALALGAGGGAGGLAAGGVFGAACGLIAAPFTLGLSVPVGAVLGGGVGLCAGTAAGATSGLVAGGLSGYWRAHYSAAA